MVDSAREATNATDANPNSSRDLGVLELVMLMAPLSEKAIPIDDTNEAILLKSLYGTPFLRVGDHGHLVQCLTGGSGEHLHSLSRSQYFTLRRKHRS